MIQDTETMQRHKEQLNEVYLVLLGLSREQTMFKQTEGKLAKDVKALAQNFDVEANRIAEYKRLK